MKLIVLTGLAVTARARLALELARTLTARGERLTLLDNCERPIRLEGVPTVRLAPGCACCGIAAALFQAVQRAETNLLLLVVSAQANPEALDRVVTRLGGPDRQVVTIALVDAYTRMHLPYLADCLDRYADYSVDETVTPAEVLAILDSGN